MYHKTITDMETTITRGIALEARGKFVDYITSTLNTLYYIHNKTEIPVPSIIPIEQFGVEYRLIIPSRNPEGWDAIIKGVHIMETQTSFVVSGFVVDDDYDVICKELGLDQLYSVASQLEYKFNNK